MMDKALAAIDRAERLRRQKDATWRQEHARREREMQATRAKIQALRDSRAMIPASAHDYADWLCRHLNLDGEISPAYDYPMPDRCYLATRDFAIPAGACGAMSFDVIAPEGITVTHEGYDHCAVYDEASLGKMSATLYSDVAEIIKGKERG